MLILVVNAGSSSLKCSVLDMPGERLLGEAVADWSADPARLVVRHPGQPDVSCTLLLRHHMDAFGRVLEELTQGEAPVLGRLAELAGVGHRVVHGGDTYTAGTRITPEVKTALAGLAELAPLHNPANLEGIEAAQTALPNVPHVAVFDTAFHATMPEAARVYPLPYAWYQDWGLRRYGFHGLSHAYCARRAAELLKRPAEGLKLVICHLGNGCSVSAVRDGRCLDTSMGFTPLEGLMMGTRSGSVDPGLLLHILRRRGVNPEQLDRVLNNESGLLGLSGISEDMRQILSAAGKGHARARLALAVYVHRIRQTVGAMAATLGGVDGLVFTAGVGEHAAEVRAGACDGLACLGLELDAAANAACTPDADVATSGSRGRILVMKTREDLEIARETARLVRDGKA